MGRKAWKVFTGGMNAIGSIVTGICRALGVVVYVLCAVVEAMAVIFLLAGMSRRS